MSFETSVVGVSAINRPDGRSCICSRVLSLGYFEDWQEDPTPLAWNIALRFQEQLEPWRKGVTVWPTIMKCTSFTDVLVLNRVRWCSNALGIVGVDASSLTLSPLSPLTLAGSGKPPHPGRIRMTASPIHRLAIMLSALVNYTLSRLR